MYDKVREGVGAGSADSTGRWDEAECCGKPECCENGAGGLPECVGELCRGWGACAENLVGIVLLMLRANSNGLCVCRSVQSMVWGQKGVMCGS